jgi:iron-only hydrogenase group A
MCEEVQSINAIRPAHRGFETVVQPAFDMPFADSVCSTCGQCINVCPTAAFTGHNDTQEVFEKLADPDVVKVVQMAPAVRAAIGEAFGLPVGTSLEAEVVAALRRLGFNYVFDTQFSADLTIMEEASEFLERLHSGGKLPMITSCSPGWVKAMEQFHPDMIPHVSSCKSPMSMQSAMVKTYFAERKKIDPTKIYSVAIMPCTAKKTEANRPELDVRGMRATDAVLTTRELAWMIKSAGIDLAHVEGEAFDEPMGLSSGAGTLFGASGGVMEAALRTAYELATGETLIDIEFAALRGVDGIKEATVEIDGNPLNVVVAHGLQNAHTVMDMVREDPSRYHFIEIMGCPGGCVGGGGQPYADENYHPLDPEIIKLRAKALYSLDRKQTIRRSHENPHIQRMYREFLGRPLSETSHELLHTSYQPKQPCGVIQGRPCNCAKEEDKS